MAEVTLEWVDELNAGTPLAALSTAVTPLESVYIRSNSTPPDIDPAAWRLAVFGTEQLQFSLDDLKAMASVEAVITMECAGNGRLSMDPVPDGTPWGFGGTSTVEYRGVSLHTVLEQAGVPAGSAEILFVGSDSGEVEPGRHEAYERSLPLAAALDPGVLIAWEMGGHPLTTEHGAPARLVVPCWYAMASVKWLSRIEAIAEPFTGFYQAERYVYQGEDGSADGLPVSTIRVRSLIATPSDGDVVGSPVSIAGSAWSGSAPISSVAVSTDGGDSWAEANLTQPASPHGATVWGLEWNPDPGRHAVIARATDAAGNTQPLDPVWNALGYGNNVAHRIRVTVE